MKKRNRALASATVLSLVLTSTVTATNVQAAAEVTRVPGANRETTAMEVAKQVFGTADTVVLVNGYGYADAVSATPLAKALNAPILLTNKVDVPTAELKATLATLGAKKVVIVGGTGAVTPAMETALKANYTVERIGGASRYETNANVAKEVLAKTGAKGGVLVSAEGYADALSVASIAAAKGMPVLFGNKNEVPAPVKTVAAGLDVVAVGGSGVLPASVLSTVKATRVAEGANRFETNLAVLDHFKGDLKLDNIYVAAGGATASQFADALVASAAAAKASAPVVLTGAGASTTAISNANKYVADNKNANTKVTVIGGTGSVSEAIFNDLKDAVNGKELTVDSVKAVGSTKIEISGKNLAGLKAEDVTVSDHKVDSLTVNAAGTTATVVLGDALASDEQVTVKVNSKEYKVTFGISADTVAVKEATYDNDTSKQYVKVTVNGNETSVADLQSAGYDLEFSAVTAKTSGKNVTADIFEDTTTGKLKDNLNDYITKNNATATSRDAYIQVTLTKGSDVIVSGLQKITIKNLDVVASSITDVVLESTKQKYKDGYSEADVFELNSTKLVTGEEANIKKIKVSVDGNKETIDKGNFTVKSSNAAVVYTTDKGELQAMAPGTATLTITYGNVTKTVSINVVKDERELKKVVVEKHNTDTAITSLKVAENKEVKVELVALDQYGDPISADIYVKSSNSDIFDTKLTSKATDASESGTELTLGLPKDTGSTTLSFYDSDTYSYRIGSSSLTLTVLENGDISKSTLDLYKPVSDDDAASIVSGTDKGAFSEDTTIDVSDDNYVVYQLNQFTSDGVLLGAANVKDEITVAQSRADVLDKNFGTNGVQVDGDKIIIKGNKAGTATIKVTDPDTGLTYTKKITVVDEGNSIKSVSFKSIAKPTYSTTLKYSTALNKTDSGDLDPKISGITMNKSVSQSIRLDLDNGRLYIDKNANGEYNDGTDTEIGTFTISAVGDFDNSYTNLKDGIKVVSGDDGTVMFKVLDTDGDVVAATSVKVDF
ncbi:cell wall-binding repeat-containing protein [Clostridium peptidivorans]|uniref:cell wall-binding repeat-containing protein n=1 Tax=Clostridium peptidivorans TaxID=100174 RepID=UPI000BE4276C